MKKIEVIFLTILFVIGLMAGSAQAGSPGNHGGQGRGFYGAQGQGSHGAQGRGYYGAPGRGYYGAPGRGYYGGWWPGIYWSALAVAALPWNLYNYYPQPSTVVQQDQVYEQPAPQQQDDYYWYYCENPKGYYPYISSCPSGWTKVVPNANPQTVPPN